MKMSIRFAIVSMFVTVLTTSISNAGEFYLVKCSDYLGQIEYKPMDKTEFIELTNQIRKESSLWGKAQKMAEKAWVEQKNTEHYPGHSLHPKRAMTVKRFRTQAEAEAAASKKEEIIQRSLEKKQEREEKRQKRERRSRSRRGSRSRRQSSTERREAMKAKRLECLEKAAILFADQMNTLLTATPKADSEKEAEANENEKQKPPEGKN